MDRRSFIKAGCVAGVACAGGISVLALTACTSASSVATGAQTSVNEQALTAGHWALVIDLERLSTAGDFEEIARACHSNHNVPQIDDPKTEVKWIWEERFEDCFEDWQSGYLPQGLGELAVPVLCNHCDDPVCVRVCPTEATFKRPDGIVNMDYHRCIGCRFCMTACPYQARSLNFFDPRAYLDEIDPGFPTREKGVVEKCNFCVERLEEGLPPYCVEASEGAFLFGDLEDPDSEVSLALESSLSMQRLVGLGTGPSVFYLLGSNLLEGGDEHA